MGRNAVTADGIYLYYGKHLADTDQIIESSSTIKAFCKDWSLALMSTNELAKKEFTNDPYSDFKAELEVMCVY